MSQKTSLVHSFIHSGHFYSASSSPPLLRGASDYSADTVSEFHAEAHRQLQVKDLPKVPTWRLERESNPRPSGWKSSTLETNASPCHVAARAGVEPTTLRLKVIDSTNAPPRPTFCPCFIATAALGLASKWLLFFFSWHLWGFYELVATDSKYRSTELLLKYGARVNEAGSRGVTPFEQCIFRSIMNRECREALHVLRRLVAAGAQLRPCVLQ